MPFFASSSSVQINGGSFYDVAGGHECLHVLYHAVAGNAFHDSAERYPPPRCHPETRTKMLDDLWTWSSASDPRTCLFWLHGPAGSGKSAIAQSFCQRLEVEGRLVASFFFRRGDASRGNAKKLFATIAYQLARGLPELKKMICQTMEDDPSIIDRSISFQLQQLILEPSRQSARSPVVIIIDGLDECDGHNVQQEILRSIDKAIHQQQVYLRFFVTSRPEPHIAGIFCEPGLDGFHHPVNINQSFKDVRRYLQDEFIRIHKQHHTTMAMVPQPWPTAEVLNTLVEQSSGYFIYASTIIKFIDDEYFRPSDRLNIILGIIKPGSGSPFDTLDQLYIQILSDVPQDAQPQLIRILTPIAADLQLTVPHIEQLLELEPGDVRLLLHGLHSVISVSQGDVYDKDDYVTVHHASFRDFLNDPARSGPFYVGNFHHHIDLASHILKALSYTYNDPSLNHNGHVAW
ncbi:hypothetical protein C8J57DRAFT_1077537 [Mycena rebaudengoi]|nr:hypothetical protein C8J57DRAFT_1077537 [Mycena rebaudengoi]